MSKKEIGKEKLSWALKLVFFFSGVAGLVYEVVWSRMLTDVVGSTVIAVSIAMAIFMGGLALGARFLGGVGDRSKIPLKMYALIEFFIGISALVVSKLLPHTVEWTLNLSPNLNPLVLQFLIVVVLLFIPTVLMGGTLPVLSCYVMKSKQHVGNAVGSLYGLNTLGAFVGCFLSGFYCIESLGLSGSICLAVAINFAIFIFCSHLSSKTPFDPRSQMPSFNESQSSKSVSAKVSYGFLIVYGFSGATSLGYEVLWTRLLSTSFIGTSYAFTAMLGVSLGAMAFGSIVFRKKSDSINKPFVWFAAMVFGIALWAQIILSLYSVLPLFQKVLSQLLSVSFLSQIIEILLFSALLIFVPSFLFGAMFPLAVRIWVGDKTKVGQNVGLLYTFNTIGCVAGSLIIGLFLLPKVGTQNALMVLSVVNLFTAIYTILLSKTLRVKKWLFVGATTITLILLIIFVPKNLVEKTINKRVNRPWNVVEFNEGLDSNTIILQYGDSHLHRLMTSFYQYIGDNSPIMIRVQKLQALLPILLKDSPENILFVGMGTGITPGAATVYPADITCVEISRDVMMASKHFKEESRNILHNDKINLVQGDGRKYLLQSQGAYDLIIGDLYNAALAGMGNLYTKEYYELCLGKMSQDGIMVQWISMKDFPEKDLKSVMATFSSVFPHVALWDAIPDILAMVGSQEPLSADLNRINNTMKLPDLRPALKEVGLVNPFSLMSHFLMNQESWEKYVVNSPIITDDRPFVEYTIPRSLHYLNYEQEMPEMLRSISSNKTILVSPEKQKLNSFEKRLNNISLAQSDVFEGYALFLEKDFDRAKEKFEQALLKDSGNVNAKLLLDLCGG